MSEEKICQLTLRGRFRGILLGAAVGDSIGLRAEGLSPRRAGKLFQGRWRQRLVFNRGMVSDDTDHAVFVAQSLLAHPDSSQRFARRLSWCFRWWLLAVPAGIGFATLRSIIRLWLSVSPSRSGVYSAGNGPAMRSAPLGAFFSSDPGQMDEYLEASTRLTHSDPRALTGAKAVAYLAGWSIRDSLVQRPALEDFLAVLHGAGEQDREWSAAVESIETACLSNLPVLQFAESLGLSNGVTGYVYHTVPVAVYAWYHHFGRYEETVAAVLDCGGDTDTVGAIAGALAGGVVGEQGIPNDWLNGIWEWPRTISVLKAIADRLADKSQGADAGTPVRYFWPGLLPRNALFLVVVLLHGIRRLAPPY